VHMAYGFSAESHRERYRAGKVPNETPYGLHYAESLGWNITYSVDYPESRIGNFSRRALIRVLGFDLIHAYKNRNLLQSADIVWTMEEISFLAVCALPYFVRGMKRPRLIAQSIWLFNKWHSYSFARRWMLKKLLNRTDVLTFHSQNYIETAASIVPNVPKQVLAYGVSPETFPLTQKPTTLHTPIRLLSMGNDPTRDWPTLLSAFGGDDRFELRIVCNWVTDAMIANYKNVQCPRDPTMQEFQDLYHWADAVIVPMVPNLYSGITVAMEAASMGVPIVSSDTGSIPTYFDRDEVLYIPPQDATALRETLGACTKEDLASLAAKAQARFVKDDYTTHGLAKRYVALSQKLLEA